MTRMFFSSRGCEGVDTATSSYTADRQGFIHVDDVHDVATLQAGGYVIAGGMPRVQKYWVCECGWEASINSCPKCNRTDLTRVEK